MGSANLEILSLSPDPAELARLLKQFSKEPGTITAFDDARLGLARDLGYDENLAELVSFGDLLGRICVEIGVRPSSLATRGQIRAAVQLACEDLETGSVFHACRNFPGFHDSLADTLNELHHWDIGPDQLESAALSGSEPLRDKLLAIREVDVAARASLESVCRVFSSDRAHLILGTEITKAPHISRLLVLAGSDVRPVELQVLRRLSEHGVHVIVAIEASPGAFEGGTVIASLLGQTPKKFVKSDHWSRALFEDSTSEVGPDAVIFSAADALSECEWALRLCQTEFSSGTAEHRIVIHVNDARTYVPLLMMSAQRFDIRLDARVMTPLLTNGFAHMVALILEALVQPHVRGIERIAGSTYLGNSLAQRRRVKEFVREAGRGGADPWKQANDFADVHREDLPWLWPILAWRERAGAANRNLSEWHAMLEELLRLDVLESSAQDLESHKREHDRRAQIGLLRALVDFAPSFDALRKPSLDLRAFVRLAHQLWELEQIVLPTAGRGFRVVSNSIEIGEADIVVSLGMLEGVMPKRRMENSILGDEERGALAAALPDLTPLLDSFFEARSQRDEMLRVVAAARKKLILGYPQTDEDRDNVPTSYLEDVKRLLPNCKVENYPHRMMVPPEVACRLQVDLDLRSALDDPVKEMPFELLDDPAARAVIRPDFEQTGVGIREVSSALRCPFQSAARYRLKLSPSGLRLERRLHRLPENAQLLIAETEADAIRALEGELRRVVDEESHGSEPWELTLLEAGASRYMRGWVQREFRAREIWKRDPGSERTNVTFDDPALRNTIKVDDRTVRFVGEVAGMAHIGPYQVLQLFRTASAEMPDLFKEEDQWVEFALLFAAGLKAGKPVAIEVDSTSGERRLLVLDREKTDDTLRMDTRLRLQVDSVKMPPRQLRDELIALLRRAILALDSGDMKAIPSQHCQACDFGELCRVSSELIDLSDLFGGDDEDE